MKRLALALFVFVVTCHESAYAHPQGYVVTVRRVIDGDSLVLDFHFPFGVHVERSARLLCVNTPEVYGATREAGLRAKAETVAWVASAGAVIAEFGPDEEDKYGRALVVLRGLSFVGSSLNRHLLDTGNAVFYLCPEGMAY